MLESSSREPFLGDLPLQVLSSVSGPGEILPEDWEKGQKTLCLQSSKATPTPILAPEEAGHNIQEKDPGLVADAIKRLLQGVEQDL